MIKVTVKLFGPEAQLAGRREVVVELPTERPTCGEVRQRLGEVLPALRGHVASCRLAVNHGFARDDDAISPEDEVALIGRVSGG